MQDRARFGGAKVRIDDRVDDRVQMPVQLSRVVVDQQNRSHQREQRDDRRRRQRRGDRHPGAQRH